MSGITAATIVDIARARHPAFAQAHAPDGVILQQMNARQRTLVLQYAGAVDGLVNTTVSLATVISGVLVGSSGNTPVYGTTYQDGWPVHQTDDGVPYVDFAGVPVAGDPFGEHGGVPGFPLPTDFLKVILVSAVLSDNRVIPVDVIPEVERLARQRLGRLVACVSGNRLVPVRPLSTGNSSDTWSQPITSIQLSYVALPVLTALTDTLMLPAPLMEALTADMAEFLAFNTPSLSGAEKSAFSADARRAEDAVAAFGIDVVGAATPRSVVFRR